MSNEKIRELRNKIDAIDEKIVSLLDERACVAKEIGEVKKAEGKPVVDREREKNILEKVKNYSKTISSKAMEKIFRKIIEATTEIEKKTSEGGS
ncbi:chorismate mutase [Candidatus Micrarchaeota archaeon]|nr:chorismate mutase [Candidatus Micrarchaeota archaeon]